jgi:hypothetical protein
VRMGRVESGVLPDDGWEVLVYVLLFLGLGILTVEHGFDVESHQFVPSALGEVLVLPAPV